MMPNLMLHHLVVCIFAECISARLKIIIMMCIYAYILVNLSCFKMLHVMFTNVVCTYMNEVELHAADWERRYRLAMEVG